MRQLGNSDRVYVFLSDAYLKSPNCMYELLLIWQSSGDEPDRFLNRIKVLIMPDASIFSISARLGYAAYWKHQRDGLRRQIDENGIEILGATELKNWQNIDRFARHVDEMLVQIADVLHPSDFDEFVENSTTW